MNRTGSVESMGRGEVPRAWTRTGAARRVLKPGHAYSRVHVDDIAGVLRASMGNPRPGAVYNVCGDLPAGG